MNYDDKMTRDYRDISNRISESQKRRALEREENLIKKNTKKKKIKKVVATAVAAAVIASAGAYAAGVPNYFDGENKIVQEFMDVTDEYAVSPTSEGFTIIHNGTYCHNSSEFNNMVEEMVEQAKAAGMNDNEIFIGLEKKISHVTAKGIYENQDLNFSDRWETCINNANTKTM